MTTEILIIAAVAGIIVFFILFYYLCRFIFSIKRQLWNQQQTINLLLIIAGNVPGANKEELEKIKTLNEKEEA